MKNLIFVTILFFLISTLTLSCKKSNDDNNTPTTGVLKGVVTDTSGHAIANVRISVYNSNTNAPIGSSIKTGNTGSYSIELDPGTYYLTLSAQGYNNIPLVGTTPISLTIEAGKENISDFQMQASTIINGGSISGKVTTGGNALSGVLVIANNGINGYSAVSGADGTYFIYNVPAGTYEVKGFILNYNSDTLNVNVTASTASINNNIFMSSGASGSISGSVSFLATNSGEVDVTLTNILTKETIPGLVTTTVGGLYSITKVPNGNYLVRASYSNDSYVVDPDWIIKNGEPTVTIAGNSVTQNFSVTGAVKLVSPTNDSTTTLPIEITGSTPTFTWLPYSSTSDYVIEVSDINGKIIWGGFTNNGATITKNITISKSQLSITFNSDGKAKSTLKLNTIYRWRIYSSKDDNSSATGWKLISVSEEQKGLFKVK
jgi:hypothetical protein